MNSINKLTLSGVLRATGGRLVERFQPKTTQLVASPRTTTLDTILPSSSVTPDNFARVNSFATNSTLTNEDFLITKVVYDSRQAVAGTLFVALPGENSDGHNYISQAFGNGATACMVRSEWLEVQNNAPDGRYVVVPDTLAAFHALAKDWRDQYPTLQVTGITGSVGKTTTKEMLAAVLEQRYNVFKSPKSFNNEYSLMPVLLELQPEHQQAVIEMGAAWVFGELIRVCKVVQPSIGVVLSVSHSHFGRMRSLDNIARNKAELIESLPLDGLAVLNGDDARVKGMAQYAQCPVLYFGLKPEYDLWAEDVQSYGLGGIGFTVHWQGQSRAMRLPIIGRHLVYNALAVMAVALTKGLSWDEIEAGLSSKAGQVRFVPLAGINGATVIDDAYNASPVSTVAALDIVAETPVRGRKLALLGDMLELGDYTEEGHQLVGRRAAEVLDQLFVIGELGRIIGQSAEEQGANVTYVSDKAQAALLLGQTLQPGDILLIKASRGLGLETVVEEVRAERA